jgi:hypothetical protein
MLLYQIIQFGNTYPDQVAGDGIEKQQLGLKLFAHSLPIGNKVTRECHVLTRAVHIGIAFLPVLKLATHKGLQFIRGTAGGMRIAAHQKGLTAACAAGRVVVYTELVWHLVPQSGDPSTHSGRPFI